MKADKNKYVPDGQESAGIKKMKTRIVRGAYPDRQFDIDFWQEQGDEAIFAAAWDMIVMAEECKHGKQPAFRRTITKIYRL